MSYLRPTVNSVLSSATTINGDLLNQDLVFNCTNDTALTHTVNVANFSDQFVTFVHTGSHPSNIITIQTSSTNNKIGGANVWQLVQRGGSVTFHINNGVGTLIDKTLGAIIAPPLDIVSNTSLSVAYGFRKLRSAHNESVAKIFTNQFSGSQLFPILNDLGYGVDAGAELSRLGGSGAADAKCAILYDQSGSAPNALEYWSSGEDFDNEVPIFWNSSTGLNIRQGRVGMKAGPDGTYNKYLRNNSWLKNMGTEGDSPLEIMVILSSDNFDIGDSNHIIEIQGDPTTMMIGCSNNSAKLGYISGGYGDWVVSGGSLTNGKKHVLGGSWDNSNFRLYIDGLEQGTPFAPADPQFIGFPFSYSFIGRSTNASMNFMNYHYEFIVFGRVLTSDERILIANSMLAYHNAY